MDQIKVLEVGGFISGPFCTMLLADFGAQVTKVEPPEGGDAFRGWEQELGDNPTFRTFNRSKKSLALDISKPKGREVFLKLVPDTDVVVENLRPGKMGAIGLGYSELSRINPRIVYCSISCYGATGEYSPRPGYDAVAQAMSGWLSLITDLHDPNPIGPAIADQMSGLFAAYGVLGALVQRDKTGKGSYLEVSMLESCIQMAAANIQQQLATGKVQAASSRPKRSQSYGFVASDGLPFVIHLSSLPKFWLGLLKVTGLEDWSKRYANLPVRVEKYNEIRSGLQSVFATKPRDYWLKQLVEQDVPCAPVYNTAEVLQDPNIAKMEIVSYTAGKPHIMSPVRSEWIERKAGKPPSLGENTESILRELNLETEIPSLKKDKII